MSYSKSSIAAARTCLLPLLTVNGSLIFGWGGFGFYDAPVHTAISLLLSAEAIIACLKESLDRGTQIVQRQSLLLLFSFVWPMMNVAMTWSIRTGYFSCIAITPAWVRWSGAFLFALGLSWRGWSIYSLGKFFSLHVTVFSSHALVTRGPYSLCRHPAYAAANLQLIGLILVFPSYFPVLGWLLFALLIAVRIVDEEELLRRTFPLEYPAYSRTVPRLVPRFF